MRFRTTLLTVLASLAIVFAVSEPRAGDVPATPSDFIQSLADNAIATLTVGTISREERITRFHALLRENFAVPTIGRWVLGRYWAKATDDQRREYLSLFESLIVATYVDRFGEYAGETLTIVKVADAGDGDVVVLTQITRPNTSQPIEVGWRVRRHDQRFWIVDVVAEGISMGQTQRAEFASVIRRTGGEIEGLLVELRKGPAGQIVSVR